MQKKDKREEWIPNNLQLPLYLPDPNHKCIDISMSTTCKKNIFRNLEIVNRQDEYFF